MADFSCASTKRTSQAPMSWEAPVRFRVSIELDPGFRTIG